MLCTATHTLPLNAVGNSIGLCTLYIVVLKVIVSEPLISVRCCYVTENNGPLTSIGRQSTEETIQQQKMDTRNCSITH